MSISLAINYQQIETLDLSPVEKEIESILKQQSLTNYEQKINFNIDFPLQPDDPRELSEIPEIRLFFLRLDARYPWFLFFLDWKSGELARYIAMLVPHQFNRTEGIIYNPEALEILVMNKIFVLTDWLKQNNIPFKSRLKSMAQTLGYEIDDTFFDTL